MRVTYGCGRAPMVSLLVLVAAGGLWAAGAAAGPVEQDASAPAPTSGTTPASTPTPNGVDNPLRLEGMHVCTHTETQMVRSTQVVMTPVTVQVLTWCINVPPRCTKNTTEMHRKTIEQVIPRTVIVSRCCAGFRPDPPGPSPYPAFAAALSAPLPPLPALSTPFPSTTLPPHSGPRRCVPDCPLGCDHGTCAEPHRCDCDAGYSGLRCDSPCPVGTWGDGCAGNCSCAHGGACDGATGACACPSGWRGVRCEQACFRGTWGPACARRCPPCQPPHAACHPATGECPAAPAAQPSPPPGALQLPPQPPPPPPVRRVEDAAAPGNTLDAAQEESAEAEHEGCEGAGCTHGAVDSSWEPVQRLTQEPPDAAAAATDAPFTGAAPDAPDVPDAPDAPDAAPTELPDADDDSDESVDADGDLTTSYPDPGPNTDPSPLAPEANPTLAPASPATPAAPEAPAPPPGPRGDKDTEVLRKKAADAKKQRAKDRARDKAAPPPARKDSEDSEEPSEAEVAPPAWPALPPELTPAHWPQVPDDDPAPPAASAATPWPHPAAANNIAPDLKPQDLASLKAPAVAPPGAPAAPAPPPAPADGPGGFSLSTLEVAAGAAVLGAALVGVAALAAARCGGGGGGGGCCGARLGPKGRRGAEVAGAGGDAVELRAMSGRPLAQTDAVAATEDTAALAVRPLFFSPLYLPAAAGAPGPGSELPSPGDAPAVGVAGTPTGAPGAAAGAGGGLVLTALFSAPASAHLQQLCALQPSQEVALLRESLSAHYDVPPTLLRRPTLTAADRRASLPAASAATAGAGPLAAPGALSWAPDPLPAASLYLSPPPPTPAPAAMRASALLPDTPCSQGTPGAVSDHVYEELPCWPRLR